jgi:hypothetical protein
MLRPHEFSHLRSRARTALALAALAASSLWTAGSAAQDRWSTPFPGIRRLDRTASGPRRIHALEIDLCRAGVSLRATREGERRQTVPAYGSASGVEAAVNADFFSFETYLPGGAAVGNGDAWHADSRGAGTVAFGPGRVMLSPPSELLDPLPAWAREAIGGHPLILRDGDTVSDTSSLCTARHPRTAAGLSEDRQTLILVVVDGRSSSSIGMTCAETAALLRGLGAHDGLNLDGGGSSAMWIRGTGVVNAPSDGSPRVVSNHLGVNATGSGLATSCMPWEPDEVEMFAPVIEEGRTSDVDGDGRADVCARAAAGIRCVLGGGTGAEIVGPELSDASGWGVPRHWSTIQTGDVNGDGLADLCARANAGMRCWPSTGTAFGAAIAGPLLSDAAGWNAPERYSTIRLADVDGDGDDDLCANGAAGFDCWRSTGAAFADDFDVLPATAGWSALERFGTLRMGDVDGDGLADLCGRGAEGVDCWLSTGVGFDPAPIAGPRWADAGWRSHRTFSTIRLADVDGDGRADLCGRSTTDYRCHLSTGAGFGAAIAIAEVADARGWDDYANYSTLRLADVDGDGDLDLCGRADSGMGCWPFEGGAFGARVAGPALSDASGWAQPAHYRTIRFADVDADGDEDLCARASAGVLCWIADGTGAFPTRIDGPTWSNASGWGDARYHATLRIAGVHRDRPPPPPDGGTPTSDAGPIDPRIDASVLVVRDAGPIVTGDAGSMPPGADAGRRTGEMIAGCACRAQPRTSPSYLALAPALALALALRARRARP